MIITYYCIDTASFLSGRKKKIKRLDLAALIVTWFAFVHV